MLYVYLLTSKYLTRERELKNMLIFSAATRIYYTYVSSFKCYNSSKERENSNKKSLLVEIAIAVSYILRTNHKSFDFEFIPLILSPISLFRNISKPLVLFHTQFERK